MVNLISCMRNRHPKRRNHVQMAASDGTEGTHTIIELRSTGQPSACPYTFPVEKKTQATFAWIFSIHFRKLLVRHSARTSLVTLRNML